MQKAIHITIIYELRQVSIHTKYYYIFYLVGTVLQVWAQPADTLLDIPTIEISASRIDHSHPTDYALDTLGLGIFAQGSIVQSLATETPLFAKVYGPAGIATSSLRGGSASHTQVSWNGIPIAHPGLGQTDLSLLPAALMDEVVVGLGAQNTTAYSSPAGDVRLSSNLPDAIGSFVKLGALAGSFDMQQYSGHYAQVDSQWAAGLRVFYHRAENDFLFTDGKGERKRMPHAQTTGWGYLPSVRYISPKGTKWTAFAWHQGSNRNLPPTRFEPNSQAVQEDENLRAGLRWEPFSKQHYIRVQLAYLTDRIDYFDPNADIDAKSNTYTTLANAEMSGRFNRQWQWTAGTHYRYIRAKSSGYPLQPTRNRMAAFGHIKWTALPSNLMVDISFRQEYADNDWQNFLPAIKINYALGHRLQFSGRVARHQRLPTFNDWYFQPGGNPELLSENGYSADLSMMYALDDVIQLNVTGYNLWIKDWIIWLPSVFGYFTPVNVQSVRSRGIEGQLKADWPIGGGNFSLVAKGQWVDAVNQKTKSPNDRSAGKQLIYTPMWRAMARLRWKKDKWMTDFTHRYIGKTFILADNSAFLPSYVLGEWRLNYSIGSWQLTARIDNLYNAEYEIIANYAMPGRSIYIGGIKQF